MKATVIFLRAALAIGFLSAVADRFGFWGAPGAPGVAWGNFENFTTYTGTLNPWAPAALVGMLAIAATAAEVILALLLLIGFQTRLTALASGALLITFAVTMTITLGPKAPLDYSVWSASAAAFALAVLSPKFRG